MRSSVAIPLFRLAGICVCITLVANPTLAEDKPALPETLVKAFEFTDKDKDQRVTLDEFLAVRNPADVAKRDFKLFDLNENGFLELAEFVTVPFLAEGPERGPLPDPMNDILENLSDSLDKFFGDWGKQPESQIQTVRFFQDLNNHFAASNIRFNNGTIDEDRNGFVNRTEAHRFLEIQLGIRRGDGQLLRKPDGRVFNYMLFLHIDQNKNNLIERTEYLERAFFTENREKEFKDCDTNGNN